MRLALEGEPLMVDQFASASANLALHAKVEVAPAALVLSLEWHVPEARQQAY